MQSDLHQQRPIPQGRLLPRSQHLVTDIVSIVSSTGDFAYDAYIGQQAGTKALTDPLYQVQRLCVKLHHDSRLTQTIESDHVQQT